MQGIPGGGERIKRFEEELEYASEPVGASEKT